MAAPPSKTLKDLNGTYTMNKELSGDTNAILMLQGVGWVTRKAIGYATITLEVKQYTDDDGIVRIDIGQTASGLPGTTEHRVFNWEAAGHTDRIFGTVVGRSRTVKLADIEEEFGSKDVEYLGHDMEPAEEYIQSYVISEEGKWIANQIWGFQVINGVRYYCRNVVVSSTKKNGGVQKATLVYNFVE